MQAIGRSSGSRDGRRRPLAFGGLGALVVLFVMVVSAAAAGAHVTVQPPEAKQGGYTAVAFRTPNERPVPTIKLEVQFPKETPIANVSVKPVTGWNYEVTKRTLDTPLEVHGRQITEVVDTITWSGGEIKPGEYQDFSVSMGPLPKDVSEMVFPAIQTYQGGEEVRWVERRQPGQEEPEHPAPVLKLVAASDSSSTTAGTAAPAAGSAAGAPTAIAAADISGVQDTADRAEKFGMAGVAVGLVALIIGIWSVVAARRESGS